MNDSHDDRPVVADGNAPMVPPTPPPPGTDGSTAEPDLAGDAGPDPTPGHVADEDPDEDTHEGAAEVLDPAALRRRKRYYITGSALGLVIALIVACAFIQLPYYRYAPGTLYSTQDLISVQGAPTYKDDGPIDFTTVSSKKISVLEAGLARFDPAVELVDAKLVDGDKTPEETRQINLEAMADSKQTAEVLAAHKLGFPVDIIGTGAVVKTAEGPSQGILQKNDTIVTIDDAPVTSADEVIAILAGHKPGDTVRLGVEGPPDPVTHGAPPPRTVSVVLGARENEPERPLLGVSLGTRAPRYELPFTIDIDSKSVAGPSAGLAFTLGIIDVLTPGSLTGNKKVAVTGAIDLGGSVLPIGGIQQKTYLARRQGSELFLVPPEELEAARRFAGDMKVVGVANLDEALSALADNGGSVDVVQQAAAARTPGTTGH